MNPPQAVPPGGRWDATPPTPLGQGLKFAAEPPAIGSGLEVADGVVWLRLPMPGRLGFVNVYALDDGPGWTLIDTGPNTPEAAQAWADLWAGPLGGRPIQRVVLTHHHADHAGRVAALAEQGASLWASRAAWLTLRMQLREPPQEVAGYRARLLRRLGMSESLIPACLEAAAVHDGYSTLPPPSYRRLMEGDELEMGGRRWRVRLSDGHAPEHASFWSEDGSLAILADQALPSTSSNIGTDPREPDGNTLGPWLDALSRLGRLADDRRLALAGHDRPYRGLPFRLQQMAANHAAVLGRLRARLADGPLCACEVLSLVHGAAMSPPEIALAAAEMHAHLLHLCRRGEATFAIDARGAAVFRAAATPLHR